jgi:hypothetical protein
MTMTVNAQPHPFLNDLAEHVVLISSVLRQPVAGREQVLAVVKAGASLYVTQTPKFLGAVGQRTFFEYDVTLDGELSAAGMVSILRDSDGQVIELNIAFSPLGSVLAIATGVRERLSDDLDAAFFL